MEVFDQYSALLALGMPPCLPKPHDADAEAPADAAAEEGGAEEEKKAEG